jgi:hypothetical protein
MKIPNDVHQSARWRIRAIAPDFAVEDVWALPARGRAEDFALLLEMMTTSDPSELPSLGGRVLWGARDLLGRLGLGRVSTPADDAAAGLTIPGTDESSLAERLPADLVGTAEDIHFDTLPFVPLYRTADEFAAELSNPTVHAVMHLAWAEQADGIFQGQLAVYVKPRGRLGRAYLAFIKPFRLLLVYPAMMRHLDRRWRTVVAAAG